MGWDGLTVENDQVFLICGEVPDSAANLTAYLTLFQPSLVYFAKYRGQVQVKQLG